MFDARESRQAEESEAADQLKDGRKSRKENRVRWAEILASYQSDETSSASPPSSMGEIVRGESPIDELALPEFVSAAAALEQLEAPVTKPTVKRTRASRLQAPTPIKKVMTSEPKPSIGQTTQPPKKPSGSTKGMATRRTKIASLGMSVNGTPAPKRRTRAIS